MMPLIEFRCTCAMFRLGESFSPHNLSTNLFFLSQRGGRVVRWSLGKIPVPRRPTNLDNSRARVYCACSRCGWGLFGRVFLWSIISLFFLPLSVSKGRLTPNLSFLPLWQKIEYEILSAAPLLSRSDFNLTNLTHIYHDQGRHLIKSS